MASNTGSITDIRKKFHSLHDLISTSYHEAGHTIYGLLHGLNIELVQVFETKKTKRIDGFTHYNPLELNKVQYLLKIKSELEKNNKLKAIFFLLKLSKFNIRYLFVAFSLSVPILNKKITNKLINHYWYQLKTHII